MGKDSNHRKILAQERDHPCAPSSMQIGNDSEVQIQMGGSQETEKFYWYELAAQLLFHAKLFKKENIYLYTAF